MRMGLAFWDGGAEISGLGFYCADSYSPLRVERFTDNLLLAAADVGDVSDTHLGSLLDRWCSLVP